nr:MAG TPA: hypothetical protein [Caudoviricetes sp.]
MTNEEAKMLVEIAKRLRKKVLPLPEPGKKEYYRADSLAKTKPFLIQVFRSKGRKTKYNISLLYRKRTLLLRVDTDGPGDHWNSDDSVIPRHTPHLHFYNENLPKENRCHDAIPLPGAFRSPEDGILLLKDFLAYIHIEDLVEIQVIQQGGFEYEFS